MAEGKTGCACVGGSGRPLQPPTTGAVLSQITPELLTAAERHISVTGASIRRTAELHGVPESTLRYHLNGRKRSSGVQDVRDEEEQALVALPDGAHVEIPVFTRDYRDRDVHRVYPLGDIHLGASHHSADAWAEWRAYLVEADNTSLLHTGDLFNAALKDSKSEAYDETMTVGSGIKVARAQFAPLAAQDKVDLMIPGNHDLRVYKAAGVDPVEVVADALGIQYARSAALVRYLVGDVEYLLYLRHGVGLGGSASARVNQMVRGAHVVFADIHVAGHTHGQAVVKDDQFVFDPESGRTVRHTRTYLNAGSFVGYEPYAAERGYVPSRIGAPRIRLDGRRKDVHVSI